MKISFNPRYNIAYIRLREPMLEIETVRVSDELSIDMAPDGTVYGIELLNANEQLVEGGFTVAVENSATGEHNEMALPGSAA